MKVPGGGDHPTAVACSRDSLVVATARNFGAVSVYSLNGKSEPPVAARQISVGLSSPARCLFLSGTGAHPFVGVSSLGIDTSLRVFLVSSGAAISPLSFRHQQGINQVSSSADGRLVAVATNSADVRVFRGSKQEKKKGGSAPSKLEKALVLNAIVGTKLVAGKGAGILSASLTQHPSEVPHGLCDRCVVLGAGGVISVFDAGEESLSQAKALFSKPFGEISGVDAGGDDGRPVLLSASPCGRCVVVVCRGGSTEHRIVLLGCGLLPHEEKMPAARREKARLGSKGGSVDGEHKRPPTGAETDW